MEDKNQYFNTRRSFLRNVIGAATASALMPGKSLAYESLEKDIHAEKSRSDCEKGQEPDIETAKLWWPDQRNVFTPIGWKDHFFRFNVLYNGTIVAEPFGKDSSRKHAEKFKGQGFLVSFMPWPNVNLPSLPKEQIPQWKVDGGHGTQGWNKETETPVLWTDFLLQEGMVIRQEVFAHITGGGDVTDGLDPLFAWIRLKVIYIDPIRAVQQFPMFLRLSGNYLELLSRYTHENGMTLEVSPNRIPYRTELTSSFYNEDGKAGLRILEPDGKIRFSVMPTTGDKVSFFQESEGQYAIKVDLKGEIGDQVDFLMPLFPMLPADIAEEENIGFDNALIQSNTYWEKEAMPQNRFQVPEDYINEAIYRSVKFVPVLTSRDYITKEYSFLSGSWGYDQLWPTPTSMNSHMFLSLLGEHETVAKYSEIYKVHQGSIKPPGSAYDLHPGYYASPGYLTYLDWLADHGAVLLQITTHALLTDDKAFIQHWTESILKACDFIKYASSIKGHSGIEGLMPPAVATDDKVEAQAIWSLSWNYKGLVKAVQLLKRIKHPRAEEFADFAKQYKETFVVAFREAAGKAPKWKDNDGNEHPVPIRTLIPARRTGADDAFSLDAGPLVLVWAGLFDATDPLMHAARIFFREGPNWVLKGPRYNALSRPVLEREMSSCEPCYSWNVIHSWQLEDRERYLEGMYSLFTGALSQQTYTSCEHRTGMQGTLFVIPLAFWMARMALIDDEIKENEIHLLRFCPLAWISSEKETILSEIPTIYGPVNLRLRLDENLQSLRINFEGKWREQPQKTILHIPPVSGLKKVVVNGKSYKLGNRKELSFRT